MVLGLFSFCRAKTMPRNYARKREDHEESTMELAVKLVVEDGLTLCRSSERTSVPFHTLQRYVHKFKEDSNGTKFKPIYKKIVLDGEMESEMTEYLVMCSKLNYGLTMKDARILAYDLAKANGLEVPENWDRDKMAGRDWIGSFLKRHPLSLEKPEGHSLARDTAFNKKNGQFFANLEEIFSKFPSLTNGTRIYNLDETALTAVGISEKVIAKTGERRVPK